jgi:hypothetical protein
MSFIRDAIAAVRGVFLPQRGNAGAASKVKEVAAMLKVIHQ